MSPNADLGGRYRPDPSMLADHLESDLHDYRFGPHDDPEAEFYALDELHHALHRRGAVPVQHGYRKHDDRHRSL